ncbi:MAG: HAD-IIIA family hydrolase [Bacteroidales bacterium]|nr:HAD-IIIA family hydrolase [Bacteroidales bacterium]
MNNGKINLTSNTSLFLDRDGVINIRKIGGYIQSYDEFRFENKVKEALRIFNSKFNHIFIVTNQQGIGKGLMSEQDFLTLTDCMLADITKSGGRIDKVYHCPDLKEVSSPNRKPNVGMAFKAARDFPEIVFSDSIMAGDSNSDMLFGKRCGMTTVFIDNKTGEDYDEELIDYKFDSLFSFAEFLIK